MTEAQWNIFKKFRESFKTECQKWQKFSELLIPLQKEAAQKDTPDYSFENAVVYNTALDEITRDSEIKKIVIGDNPGKSEQLNANQKYLVGQAGKIAQGFFEKNPELKTDFRKNVIILNKTPVHSAKTNHLNFIQQKLQNYDSQISTLIKDSQIWMAKKTAALHKQLWHAASLENRDLPELWLVGYAELKDKGIFIPYKEALVKEYENDLSWDSVFVYQHFSMNRFSIDLKKFREKNKDQNLSQSIKKLGEIHRVEIMGK